MNQKLILIIGATMSGKTWLANCIYVFGKRDQTVIIDDPDLTKRIVRCTIERDLKFGKTVIITTNVQPIWPAEMPKWDLLISLRPNE